jgi:spore coat polysaccharide biosynthesis protein SpsF
MRKRVIILQARMTSTRLPGKVLKPIAGKPMLAWELDQLASVGNCDQVVVATTTNREDDPVESLARDRGIACYRGSEHDVLGRYAEAARIFQAQTVIRVTGDCPLIDPDIVASVIRLYAERQPVDYASNTLERTFPRGCDVEVFSADSLNAANAEAQNPAEREHVTPFLYFRPERFQIVQYQQDVDESQLRWTVDTPEDLELIANILTAIGSRATPFHKANVLAVLNEHPDWIKINAHVEQVKV